MTNQEKLNQAIFLVTDERTSFPSVVFFWDIANRLLYFKPGEFFGDIENAEKEFEQKATKNFIRKLDEFCMSDLDVEKRISFLKNLMYRLPCFYGQNSEEKELYLKLLIQRKIDDLSCTFEEAVKYAQEGNERGLEKVAIFLKTNKGSIGEFCYQVFHSGSDSLQGSCDKMSKVIYELTD